MSHKAHKVGPTGKGQEPGSADAYPRCPVCGSGELESFFEIPQFPTFSSVLLKTADAARSYPQARLCLGFCEECGWIGNTAFDSGQLKYGEQYENSLHYSAVFQSYADRLALYLFRHFRLKGKDLIEIGCGQGDFLHSLCEIGTNRGVGFDPSYSPERGRANGHLQIRFVRDLYSADYADYPCDFLCCRHVLEHVEEPRAFLEGIRRTLAGQRKTKLYFEVPNAIYTFRETGIWDPIYEHRSYFAPQTLRRLFAVTGFQVGGVRTGFGKQFLCVYASLAAGRAQNEAKAERKRRVARLAADVRRFATHYRKTVEKHREFLQSLKRSGGRIVLWGAGAKAVNFLNAFRNEEVIEFVVDVNPHKQEMFIPGTAQKIVAPEFLQKYGPRAVVVMNPIYNKEVARKLVDMGVRAEVRAA